MTRDPASKVARLKSQLAAAEEKAAMRETITRSDQAKKATELARALRRFNSGRGDADLVAAAVRLDEIVHEVHAERLAELERIPLGAKP